MTKLQVQPHRDHDFNIMKIEILGLKQLSSINSNSISSQAIQLHRLKLEEEQRLEEAREAEEAALKLAEKETAKCQVAMDAAEAAKRIAEAEAQKRRNAEMKSFKEAEQRKKAVETTTYDPRYRKYTIKEIEVGTDNFSQALDVGEGGYGPVYKGELDHTPVAIKVLRSDAAQGWSQFQQEVGFP